MRDPLRHPSEPPVRRVLRRVPGEGTTVLIVLAASAASSRPRDRSSPSRSRRRREKTAIDRTGPVTLRLLGGSSDGVGRDDDAAGASRRVRGTSDQTDVVARPNLGETTTYFGRSTWQPRRPARPSSDEDEDAPSSDDPRGSRGRRRFRRRAGRGTATAAPRTTGGSARRAAPPTAEPTAPSRPRRRPSTPRVSAPRAARVPTARGCPRDAIPVDRAIERPTRRPRRTARPAPSAPRPSAPASSRRRGPFLVSFGRRTASRTSTSRPGRPSKLAGRLKCAARTGRVPEHARRKFWRRSFARAAAATSTFGGA